jgi:serine/threonine protein kinase
VLTLKAHPGHSPRDLSPQPGEVRAAPARSHELEPGDLVDGFQILRVLARSGMGSVYKAHDRGTGMTVVLKVPHMSCESDVVLFSRFQREERIGSRLTHPGIVRVLAARDRCRPYIVFEHVEGATLLGVLKCEGPLPSDRVVAIGLQLCEALAYAHEQGVIHRDLKPENVLLDTSGKPRIIDFGIALDFRDRRLTWGQFSNRLGTPEYMAPEQFRGQRGDARVDVYALGAILYELLAGATPFRRGSVAALMRSKLREDPVPLCHAAPDVAPPLAALIMRALARDPDARFSTINEMRCALADPLHPVPPASVGNPPSRTSVRAWALSLLAFALVWWVAHRAGLL